MVKRIVFVLLLLLFTTVAASAPLNLDEGQINNPEPQMTQEQVSKFIFLYNAFVIDREILPAIYKYLDLSDFENPPTINQQKEIINNINIVFSAYAANKKILVHRVNIQFIKNGHEMILFVYFYEYDPRVSKLALASISRQITISQKINNSEIME